MCHGQILSESFSRARKPHRCDCCARSINAGQTYHRQNVVADGGFYSTKLCQRCEALYKVFWEDNGDPDYCFSLTELRSLLREDSIGRPGWWRGIRARARKAMALTAGGAP